MEPDQRTHESKTQPLGKTQARRLAGVVFVVASVALVVGIVTLGLGRPTIDSGVAPASCALPGNSSPGGSSMQPVKLRPSNNGLLPPIDTNVHRSIETATFALG